MGWRTFVPKPPKFFSRPGRWAATTTTDLYARRGNVGFCAISGSLPSGSVELPERRCRGDNEFTVSIRVDLHVVDVDVVQSPRPGIWRGKRGVHGDPCEDRKSGVRMDREKSSDE